MHVDDNMYADTKPFLVRSVSASAAGLFDLLGWPDPARVPTPLSMEKLETLYNHQRRMVGRFFDSRRLTVGMVAYKKDNLMELLTVWLSKESYDILEIARLLGVLHNHTKYARWARCWYFTLQNAIRSCLTQRYHVVLRLQGRWTSNRRRYSRQLPASMAHRLSTLLARDKAALLWSTHCSFTVSPAVRMCLQTIYDYVKNCANPWEVPLGMAIPRSSHFGTAGDASFEGCGGSCHVLQFWYDIPWTERVRLAVRLRPSCKGYVHINDLEFITLIVMMAALKVRLANLPQRVQATAFPRGVPDIPVWLGLTDNMVSKAWESKATATSLRGQSLIGIYAELLRTTRLHTICDHIKGELNVEADDISRNDFTLSLSARFHQLFAKHPLLESFDYFLPSQDLLQLLTSRLFSEPNPRPCVLPANLGRFVPAGSTTFDSPSI
jgi:hypothetical protein